MTKYSNLIAETLDRLDPDESIGSVDELGWFGLYVDERTILEHDSQGFIDAITYNSLSEALDAWDSAVALYDEFDYALDGTVNE